MLSLNSKNINNNNCIFLEPQEFDIDLICQDLYQYGYCYVKNILDETILNGLIDTINVIISDNNMAHAHIGREHKRILEQTIRTDKIHWINGNNIYEEKLLTFLESMRLNLNKRLMLGLFNFEAHYAIYQQGDFYKRHLDSFKGQKNRIISVVIYLNKQWKIDNGGLLQLYQNTDSHNAFGAIIPEYNHAVFFLSEDIPHEVTPAFADRLSIACWFRCRT